MSKVQKDARRYRDASNFDKADAQHPCRPVGDGGSTEGSQIRYPKTSSAYPKQARHRCDLRTADEIGIHDMALRGRSYRYHQLVGSALFGTDWLSEGDFGALSPCSESATRGANVLVKVDVEGYEPDLTASLKDIVLRYWPDFLIEVLTGTPEALEGFEYLRTYERFLLTPEGPVRRPRLEADERHRDRLLQWPAWLSR
jgi:hypothetical protein